MGLRLVRGILICLVSLGAVVADGHAVPWFALGPYGGDARAIAPDPANPQHLYLGTANGWVYQSMDGGAVWQRVAQIAHRNDLVIDHILVDPASPQRLIIGAWTIDHPDGGIFISTDGGKSWYDQAQMRGQSVRSMARGVADPNEIVAGTLRGIFRSDDNGTHWKQISPVGSTEIHEVESIAIDPKNGNIIYAGTWHLPWKTTDGGEHWENIKEGIIDDSDVFSIIVDPVHPKQVYASACSGIYKSEDGGALFRKVQGIPSTARRTRKLTQDPSHLRTVFAGTTEGLYRTLDGGVQWDRLTSGNVIVNDVYVDPSNAQHVLMATDRGGILRSEDGGVSFEPSNTGFSARQVVAYAADPQNPAALYVGVVNDKATGGVFASTDGGIHWSQQSEGLGGRDVFSLLTTPDGVLFAGTGHGIFRLDSGAWQESDDLIVAEASKVAATKPAATKTIRAKTKAPVRRAPVKHVAPPAPVKHLDETIYAMSQLRDSMFAATSMGLVRSLDKGHTWEPVASLVMPDTRFLDARNKMVLAGSLRRLALSVDEGKTWDTVALPKDVTQVTAMCVDGVGNIWVGGREGVYYSTDYGETWRGLKDLFITQVDGVYFDTNSHRVLITSSNSTFAFSVALPSYKVSYRESGWHLRFARPVGDHLIGATLYDGMVVEPRMVDSVVASAR